MNPVRWGILSVAALAALSLMTVQQSAALWRDSTQITDATITSGTLSLLVGSAEGQAKSHTMPEFGGSNLIPGSVIQRPLTVRNAGDIDMKYRLQSVTQAESDGKRDVPLRLDTWIVADDAACPAASEPIGVAGYSGNLADAQWPTAPGWEALAPDATAVWCLRVTVDATADADQASVITLNYLANS